MFATLMGMASLQLIVESSKNLAAGIKNGSTGPSMDTTTWIIVGAFTQFDMLCSARDVPPSVVRVLFATPCGVVLTAPMRLPPPLPPPRCALSCCDRHKVGPLCVLPGIPEGLVLPRCSPAGTVSPSHGLSPPAPLVRVGNVADCCSRGPVAMAYDTRLS